MKRTLAWLLTLVLCLTACSAVAETKVSFFTGKIETVDLLNEIIDGFNAANPGIVVEQEYQNDASSIIKVKFASGEVPDVMTTYEQEFVDQGKYMDLSGMNEWWERLIPSMRESCTDLKTGKQYRVCTNMTMAGFFYNKEIFSKLGLTPATTWDEFVQNLTVIREKMPDVDPWFIFGKEAWHLGHLIEFIPHGYLKQSLGALECKTAMLNNDSAKLNFGASDGCMAVFAQNLLDLQAKGLINEDVLTATSDNCVEAFVTGKAAMFSNGMWALSGILEANPDMADKIGFAPYPAYMPDSQPVVLCAEDSGYSISATTQNGDAAKAFLSYLFSAENQKKYAEALGSPSAFTDVNAEWAPKAFAEEVNAALSSAVNIGFTNEKPAGFSGDDAGRMVQDLLAGTYDAQSFAQAYEKAWNEGF
ncbi:MAG: extracellular solute-binding protein [Candidatus Limiplasma sp.]|nr:extracellular solute-binding protein [Clostridiales bacterium]MDY3244894.1 extracellular solute-binding protein [Candidatus Limiplasma sp.]